MKQPNTIKRELENLGYTLIERDDTLVISNENQVENQTFLDPENGYTFDYAKEICDNYGVSVNEEIQNVIGDDYIFECEYAGTFKMYKA